MDCKVELLNIVLLDVTAKVLDRDYINESGYAVMSAEVRLVETTISQEQYSDIECVVTISFDGRKDPVEVDAEAEPAFILNTSFSGLFQLESADMVRLENDKEFKREMTEHFANKIWPLQRGYLVSALLHMGVKNADLPWDIDLNRINFDEQ